MAVRTVVRRGERRLFIDIRYRDSTGKRTRYRKDAEVQTLLAARAEDRRRLALLAATGSPFGALSPEGQPVNQEPEEDAEIAAAPAFKDVAKEYMADYAKSQLKPSTRVGYQKKLDGFLLNAIGDLPITQVSASKVRELDVELVERGAQPSTRRGHQIVLRSILGKFAVERGYLAERPRFPKLPRCGKQIHTALTKDDVDRLLAATPNPAHRRLFLLAAYAGLRAGEVRALRWRDVDLRARVLTVRLSRCKGYLSTPKSGHERLIPLAETLVRELSKTKKPLPDALVCLTSLGSPWGEYGLIQSFKRAGKRAELDASWRFHDLRHFFVTSLFLTGAPAPAVQMLAGHADLSTTQRYAHTTTTELAAAVARLGGVVGATVGQQTRRSPPRRSGATA
jgi:integrase